MLRVVPNPCERGVGSEVYLTGVGTQSGPALEGLLVINKIKKRFCFLGFIGNEDRNAFIILLVIAY